MAICTATHWLFNFVIARSVPYMITNIGYGTYFVFASMTTLSVAFVFFFLPETKGLSLEEIDVLFDGPSRDVTDITIEEGKGIDEGGSQHVERTDAAAR
jgi:hypothetical protein